VTCRARVEIDMGRGTCLGILVMLENRGEITELSLQFPAKSRILGSLTLLDYSESFNSIFVILTRRSCEL